MGKITWDSSDEEKLLELIKLGTKYSQISIILNKSLSAIYHKVNRLNINTSQIYKNNSKYKDVYQNYDWCYQKYYIEGLNHEEMALEANCTKRVVEKWCCEKHKITQKYRQQNKVFNPLQVDLIIGSLLGDGHIDKRPKQPMFIVSHAENQKDYLFYKYDILKDFCNLEPAYYPSKILVKNNKEYICQPFYRFCTRIHDCLLPFRVLNKIQIIDKLNEYSLSIFSLDDGHREKSNWELCLANFTQEERQYFINILKNKFNLDSYQNKDKRYITLRADSSRDLDKIIVKNISNHLDIVQDKIINNKNIAQKQKRCHIIHDNVEYLVSDFCRKFNINYKYTMFLLSKKNNSYEILNKLKVGV